MFYLFLAVGVLAGSNFAAAAAHAHAVSAESVRLNGVLAPAYVDPSLHDAALDVSWELVSDGPRALLGASDLTITSSSVQIHASDSALLLYDSGRVGGPRPFHRVECADVLGGLPPDQAFTITVASFYALANEIGASATTSATFHTALGSGTAGVNKDWAGAAWIGGFTELRSPIFTLPANLAVSLATAYVSGVGCFDFLVNNQLADPTSRLDPGFSTIPTMRILYRAINITSQLANGVANGGGNTVGFRLGMCKYGYLESFCTGAYAGNANCRAAILRLSVKFSDGSTRNITTGTDWFGSTQQNPIVYTHLFHGEQYDARIAASRNKTQAAWDHAIAYDTARDGLGDAVLSLHDLPVIGVSERRPAQSVVLANLTSGAPEGTLSYIFDVKQNIAGVVELDFSKLMAPLAAGVTLTLRHSEITYPDGSLYNSYCDSQPSRIMPCSKGAMDGNSANQTDRYICSGHETEHPATTTWSPRLTYHGFRYVMITGFPQGSPPPPSDFVTGMFVHSLVEKHSSVRFSDQSLPILNHIETMIQYTILGNLHSHPTDCPQREKRGWLGDAQWVSGAASLRFRMNKLYANWLRTFGDTQAVECQQVNKVVHAVSPFRPPTYQCCSRAQPTFGCDWTGTNFSEVRGALPDVIPYSRKTFGGWPGDPTWGAAAAVIPWEVLARTGEVPSAETYAVAASYVNFLTRHIAPDTGLVEFGYYGDWCSAEPTSKPQVTGWSHVLAVARAADMAEILGEDYAKDASRYKALFLRLKKAYHKVYFRPVEGDYGTSQTANALPLYLNVTPPALVPGVAKALVASLKAHKDGLLSGAMGTRYVFQALADNGYADVALEIATATAPPSFGFMALQGPAGANPGAGTVWEKWGGNAHDYAGGSKNHPMFTGGVGVYLHALAGVFRERGQIVLKPGRGDFEVAARIGGATVDVMTRAGKLRMRWHLGAALQLSVNVTIPVGLSEAVLLFVPLPRKSREMVTMMTMTGITRGGLVVVAIGDSERAAGVVRVDLGAGDWRWVLE
jgi:alpha-L-rhamnosidase